MKHLILKGKSWEIRQLLKQYGKKFTYVIELINFLHENQTKSNVNKAIVLPFEKRNQ